MKVAVIKLGSRISFNANDTSGGNGEARSIIKILETAGCEVHIFTKLLKKDDLVAPYKWHQIGLYVQDDIDEMDALLVINGNVNFFGGAEDREQILNYDVINAFKGKVFYAYCDPALTLKQLWSSIEKKPWGNTWREARINIKRDDIIYLSQPYDVEKIPELLGKNCVIPKEIIHFPFEQFPCLNPQLPYNPNPSVDLSYGGTMRGGKRIHKMIEYYLGHDEEISVEMFGKITQEDFTSHPKYGPGMLMTYPESAYPKFTGPVKYADMLPKMNDAMCHVVIGDPLYEKINDMAQRAYESIWSNVVTFIDSDLDQKRRVYGADKTLADFLYVQHRGEIAQKIMLLKKDPVTRQQILKDQIAAVNFDAIAFSKKLITIMEK